MYILPWSSFKTYETYIYILGSSLTSVILIYVPTLKTYIKKVPLINNTILFQNYEKACLR